MSDKLFDNLSDIYYNGEMKVASKVKLGTKKKGTAQRQTKVVSVRDFCRNMKSVVEDMIKYNYELQITKNSKPYFIVIPYKK